MIIFLSQTYPQSISCNFWATISCLCVLFQSPCPSSSSTDRISAKRMWVIPFFRRLCAMTLKQCNSVLHTSGCALCDIVGDGLLISTRLHRISGCYVRTSRHTCCMARVLHLTLGRYCVRAILGPGALKLDLPGKQRANYNVKVSLQRSRHDYCIKKEGNAMSWYTKVYDFWPKC